MSSIACLYVTRSMQPGIAVTTNRIVARIEAGNVNYECDMLCLFEMEADT